MGVTVWVCHADWVLRAIKYWFYHAHWGLRAIKCVFYHTDGGGPAVLKAKGTRAPRACSKGFGALGGRGVT